MLETYRFAATATRGAIEQRLRNRDLAPDERLLLRAVLAQYNGDVDGAIRTLRHLIKRLSGVQRALVADILAPILVMRHQNDEVLALAELMHSAGWQTAAIAFRAIVASDKGDRKAASGYFHLAEDQLAETLDPVVRSRVLQRLSRTAYYLDEHGRAIDLALASAKLCGKLGAWRGAAAAYSIVYNVHHNVTGEMEESDRYVRLWHAAAIKTQDESFLYGALVAEFEMAVQFADDQRVVELQTEIQSHLLPQQYTESFPLSFSHALFRGSLDLNAMRTLLQVLRDTPARTAGQWSICTALIALAEAAAYENTSARENIRLAINRLGRAPLNEPAYERRSRRLARAACSAACIILGDHVRAARTVDVKESRNGEGEHRLPELMREGTLDLAPPALRGFARVLLRANQTRRGFELPSGLTPAEFQVLRLLDRGWTALRIANETRRSINTVYNHTRAILWKLDASRAPEAVAIARERGLLP